MWQNILKKFRKFDWIFIITVILLLGLGLLSVFSTTASISLTLFHKQSFAVLLGLVFFIFFSSIDYRLFKKMSSAIFVLLFVILIGVLIFGDRIKGALSWFRFGAFGFQPVEFVKIAMIIVLAKFFTKNFRRLKNFRFILVSLIIVFIPTILIVIQPDIGSAFVIVCIWIGMTLVAGIKKSHVAILLIVAMAVGLCGWKFGLKDYQRSRITSFVNPYEDPQGQGYNAIQSVIAVGSGGFWGKGIGNGSQGQLNFLPERHTDFIFANIAEEMGLIGVSFLMALYAILLLRIIKVAFAANDNFAKFLVIGVALMIFVHVLENVGMNIGIMPITGIPLPLISFGGSSMVVTLGSLGIVASVMTHKSIVLKEDDQFDFL